MEDEITVEAVEKLIISDEVASQRTREIVDPNDTGAILSVRHRLGQRNNHRVYRRSEQRSSRFRSRSRSQDRDGSRSGSGDRNNAFKRGKHDWNGHSNAVCNYCKRIGHIRKNCWFLNKNSVKFVKQVDSTDEVPFDKFNRISINNSSDESDINCMKIGSNSNVSEPCLVEVIIQGRRLMMEIDTGSAVAVISKTLYRKLFDSVVLTKCNKKLVVVNGSKLAVAGQLLVKVSLNGRSSLEKLVILNTESDFTPLLGRDWMESFYPEWKLHFLNPGVINHLGFDTFRENAIVNIKQKYFKVFSKDFCEPISGFKADLTFKSEQPIFKRAYQVPYKLKEKFLNHLDMLEQQGVITAIKASEWASPVIAILKKDGDIRMVIDCKVSLNKVLIPDTYPLPLAQDIFASLAGCKVFCSLDLTGAYTQLELSDRSKKYVVINTVKGLYTFNRLPQVRLCSSKSWTKF
ncbi:uncharacterized protein K02A2.6-like [Ochlerotatus camptorhynchus]|uniref:uncharacterized protein K02A2.6-like n=1 Tax=Ochlerotatus camptorhynchus TaxID=644619 RepID=UPI0031DE6367